MIRSLALLLVCQLIGEIAARLTGLNVPGPVLGLALLAVLLIALPRLAGAIAPTANGLLAHLSLLFVPAGVGVVRHLDRLGGDGPALLAAIAGSTIVALVVGVYTFTLTARLTGKADR